MKNETLDGTVEQRAIVIIRALLDDPGGCARCDFGRLRTHATLRRAGINIPDPVEHCEGCTYAAAARLLAEVHEASYCSVGGPVRGLCQLQRGHGGSHKLGRVPAPSAPQGREGAR